MADKHLASRDFLEFSIPRAGKSKKKKTDFRDSFCSGTAKTVGKASTGDIPAFCRLPYRTQKYCDPEMLG